MEKNKAWAMRQAWRILAALRSEEDGVEVTADDLRRQWRYSDTCAVDILAAALREASK